MFRIFLLRSSAENLNQKRWPPMVAHIFCAPRNIAAGFITGLNILYEMLPIDHPEI